MSKDDWFLDWFDTDYYHMLYQHRDVLEAKLFLESLKEVLSLQKGSRVLDACCGRGRHTSILNNLGFETTGIDISSRNIDWAKKNQDQEIEFLHGDILSDVKENHFDMIVNLFTSFGYYEEDELNQQTLNSLVKGLNENGCLILDFLNVQSSDALAESNAEGEVQVEDVLFRWKKTVTAQHIIKSITVVDEGEEREYSERVRRFDLSNFERMCKNANARIDAVFGDYTFARFNPEQSDRLILCIRP